MKDRRFFFILWAMSWTNALARISGECREGGIVLDITEETDILVKQGAKTRHIDAKDVIYIESLGRKAMMHLQEETIEYYAKISDLEEQLRPGFFRVHRAYLVNLCHVKSYDRREVKLSNGDSVLISKYRLSAFREIIKK